MPLSERYRGDDWEGGARGQQSKRRGDDGWGGLRTREGKQERFGLYLYISYLNYTQESDR